MTVQVKLGRWRTRDGSVAIVNEVVEQDPPYRFRGTCNDAIWNWTLSGNIWSRGADSYDLIEYLGPLEPAPFDLAAFIAGLKPGDYYRQNDGKRGTFHARTNTPEGECIWVTPAGQSAPVTMFILPNVMQWAYFPAGPWVEPPKPHEFDLLAYADDKGAVFTQTIKPTAAWQYDGYKDVFRQRITYTPGKGLELGEVVKQ